MNLPPSNPIRTVKRVPFLSYTALIVLALLPQLSFAFSGWSGNGGDNQKIRNNPWFLGDETVEFCINITPDFPISHTQARSLLTEALNSWKLFFAAYGLDSKKFGLVFPNRSIRLPRDQRIGLALQFQVLRRCPDFEIRNRLVVVNFGVENDIIHSYRLLASEGEVGLAVRQEYDHTTFNNNGYIWVGGFSSEERRLQHILLHELGHVFGMPHNSTFVMSEDAALDVLSTQDLSSDYFGRIESSTWKYRLQSNDTQILTSRRGLLFDRPDGGNRLCPVDYFLPNRVIPRELKKALGLGRGCHKMELSVSPWSPTSLDRKVKFVVSDGINTNSYLGSFRATRLSLRRQSPARIGLYSQWEYKGPNRQLSKYAWLPLNVQKSDFPARGYITIGRKRFPVRISYDRGTTLEFFLPRAGQWWIINTAHAALRDRMHQMEL